MKALCGGFQHSVLPEHIVCGGSIKVYYPNAVLRTSPKQSLGRVASGMILIREIHNNFKSENLSFDSFRANFCRSKVLDNFGQSDQVKVNSNSWFKIKTIHHIFTNYHHFIIWLFQFSNCWITCSHPFLIFANVLYHSLTSKSAILLVKIKNYKKKKSKSSRNNQ